MATVGLIMMAKNEAHVITRALDSALPLMDFLLFVDTGSTDDTQGIVAQWIDKHRIPSQMIEEPWQNFAHNRSHSLAALRRIEHIGYALLLDADDALRIDVEPNAIKESLTADCYNINMLHGTIIYPLPRIVSNRKPFFFRGPLHEFLDCKDKPYSQQFLPGISQFTRRDGARSQNPTKYEDDANLLQNYLRTETDPFMQQRYTFYLAQSFRDCNKKWEAYFSYMKRADMGGWYEEVYMSLVNAARLIYSITDANALTAIDIYRRAIAVNPKRAEAIHGAAKLCRLAKLYNEGYAIAKQGIRLPMPSGLFIEAWIYEFGMADEFSINAFYADHKLESWLTCQMLLRGTLDNLTRERIKKNAQYSFIG